MKNSAQFIKIVRDHYKKHGRKLPWRETRDPYKILVSEIMLQQTQVDRVLPKYKSFLEKFPTFKKLADAPLQKVLLEWKGLGYNRRGLNLQRTAQVIARTYGGKLPKNPITLESLPGVGPYTARALSTFVYENREVFIETNIRSVFIHHFFPNKDKVTDKDILPLIENTLPSRNTRDWYYALMDYGVYLKKVHKNPSRKSTHHNKQTKFEGSHRQLRAQVLHEITRQKKTNIQKLAKLKIKKEVLQQILTELTKEGFIKEKNKIISVV